MRNVRDVGSRAATSTSLPPRNGEIAEDLPEPAWYLSSWELRSGLVVIEHDDVTTIPGDLGD